jgi:hypothetical protein
MMYSFDDGLDLAEAGYVGTVDDIRAELNAFLARYGEAPQHAAASDDGLRPSQVSSQTLDRPVVTGKPISILILAAEVMAAAYLALMAWLLSVWMVDDSVAFQMTEADWWLVGARRLGVACAVALGYAGVLWLINRRWVAPCFGPSRLILFAPAVLGGVVAAAAAVGVATFVTTKPYM